MVRIVITLFVLLLLPSVALAENRIALLIGNRDYKPGVGVLLNPLNDVRVVNDALKSVGFEVLRPTQNATRAAMLRAIHEFAGKLKDAGTEAVGFLYYSGHGIASAGENYLIPIDVEEPSTVELSVQGVKHSEVLAILRNEAPNAAHYLVLDACRNTLQGARGGKGFVPVGQQSGVLVAFSTEPGKTAADIGQGSGPYAAALAAELVKPGQSDLIMFHNVRVAVIEKTHGDQVPWTEDGIQRRERMLFGREVKPTPLSTQPMPSEAERTWTWIKGSADEMVLENFIKLYGHTEYGLKARARLAELKAQKIAAAVPVPPKSVPTATAAATRCDGIEAQVRNERRCVRPGSGKSDWFKDCSDCPEMVVVPAGDFMMGSPANEAARSSDEGPQRKVTITTPLAVGKFEVTFSEWDACVAASGCKSKPGDRGWGRNRRPVIEVSWNDAKEYVSWLAKKTGKTYRLLSEAEWEYAARAGTTTAFSTGPMITTDQANFNGNYTYGGSAKGVYRQKTIEVGSLNRPNAFGLHDVHGNVWEWVEDCYQDNYNAGPTDGSANSSASCNSRVLRGGSGLNVPEYSRSAYRGRDLPNSRTGLQGFRVARRFE